MKEKVFIAVALWGGKYTATFVAYSVATQMSRGNIPSIAKDCKITYQIITTKEDKEWLEKQVLIKELSNICTIQWDIIGDICREMSIPGSEGGEKYNFLSMLQNYSMHSALESDILIFNYADFVWADGTLRNLIDEFKPETDAIMSYCMRVDDTTGTKALRGHTDGNGIIELEPRRMVNLAMNCLHKETKHAFWDDEVFTVTPTAILWPVGNEGLLITAYHQTILALRVKPNDPLYYNGIMTTSLDGYYSAVLASHHNIIHATNSDRMFAFSLTGKMSDSTIGGPSRQEWGDYNRDDSMRELLRGKVSYDQRTFALEPIEIKRDYLDKKAWSEVKKTACEILEKFHRETSFDQNYYNEIYGYNFANISEVEQQKFLGDSNDSPSIKRRILFLARKLYSVSKRLFNFSIRVKNLAQKLLLKLSVIQFLMKCKNKSFYILSQVKSVLEYVPPSQNISKAPINPLNVEYATSLMSQGRVEELVQSVHSHMGKISAGKKEILGKKAAAYFWVATIPEKVINNINDLHHLMRLLQSAEYAFQKLESLAPLYIDGHKAYARNLWMQGKFQEAFNYFKNAEIQRIKLIDKLNLDVDAAVILPTNCAHVIGLMGHLDAFIKRKILTDNKRPYHLITAKDEVVNKTFFEYFKPYLELDYPDRVTSQKNIIDLAYSADWNWTQPDLDDDSNIIHVHSGIAKIQRQWSAESRPPLLTLSDNHHRLLEDYKSDIGMKNDDWFVCLHVRSSGFYGDKSSSVQDFRNTPISDYYDAIKAIVDEGGWVFRMGDSTMPKLELDGTDINKSKVIDYAHSSDKSEDLDVALCASCKLFVSSPSGLHVIANAFGRPVCYVNFPIYAGFPWHPEQIFTPMIYYSLANHKILSIEEILSSNLVHADHGHLLMMENVMLLRNTPDEIAETVLEALRQEDYEMQNKQDGEDARQSFEDLNQKYERDVSGKIGLYFANKHKDKLFPLDKENSDEKLVA